MHIRFFFKSVQSLDKDFSSLFDVDDEEDDEEGEESGDKGQDTGSTGTDGIIREFTEQFGWLHSIVKVRETTGLNINQVYDMNVVEFLNYLIYIRSWANVQHSITEAERKRHKLK